MPVRFNVLYGQLFINDPGDNDGWSEGYYMKTPDAQTAFDGLVDQIYPKRRVMLGPEYKLVHARVSNCSIRGDAFTAPLPAEPKMNWGLFASEPGYGAPNNLVLSYTLEAANPAFKSHRPLHGLPNARINRTEDSRLFLPGPFWDSAFLPFIDVLKDLCQLPKVSATASGSKQTLLVDAITDTSPFIHLANETIFPKKPGFWLKVGAEQMKVITVQGEGFYEVQRPFEGSTPAAHAAGSLVTAQPLDVVTFQPITKASYPARCTYHKVGRPFGLLVGRRARR